MACRRSVAFLVALAFTLSALIAAPAAAQTVVKIGLISSYTGFVAQAGDQAQKAIDLYIKEHDKDLPPDVKIEILRRDDTANPEVGKRLAQELITREHVQLLTGVILSPVAAAIAPLTAEAKVPLLISIAAGGSAIPRISPYVARVSFTLGNRATRSANGPPNKAGKPATPQSAISSRGMIRKPPSQKASPMAAARSSALCGCRRRARISCLSCSASETPSPMSSSCGSRARRRPR
jgi:hypothetical protein